MKGIIHRIEDEVFLRKIVGNALGPAIKISDVDRLYEDMAETKFEVVEIREDFETLLELQSLFSASIMRDEDLVSVPLVPDEVLVETVENLLAKEN